MIDPEVFAKVGDLPDADIELLLMHVDGHLDNEDEKGRAEALLDRIRSVIRD